jgi:hypothetical protein
VIATTSGSLANPPPTTVRLRTLARALRAGAADLRTLPMEARIAAVDRVAAAWLAPASPWHDRGLCAVVGSTGYARAAIESGLENLWSALRRPHLAATVRAELGDALPDPARLPRLALHVLAGNVPGAGIFGIIGALLAGVPSLVKPAAREPYLPTFLVESLGEIAPELRRAVAVATWRGGDPELDTVAVDEADLVLAYGRTETLDELARLRPRRMLRFGPRVSVALIAAGEASARTAGILARQIAIFDQQGCLSPQVAFIEESSPAETRRFCALVAEELRQLEHAMPRAPLTLAESTAVWRFVEQQRWRAQEGEDVECHGDDQGLFGVVCDRTSDVPMSPLFRHLVMVPVPSLAAVAERIAPLIGLVEAIGYVGRPERLGEAAAIADACGAHRLCPLERLQAPSFDWRQTGHARLACFTADAASAVGG